MGVSALGSVAWIGELFPGPSSNDLFIPPVLKPELAAEFAADVLVEPFMSGVAALGAVGCRLAAGVAKKSAADLLPAVDGGAAFWVGAGVDFWPLAAASLSRRKVLHCESMWLLISELLTGRSHIGHATIVAGVASDSAVYFELQGGEISDGNPIVECKQDEDKTSKQMK